MKTGLYGAMRSERDGERERLTEKRTEVERETVRDKLCRQKESRILCYVGSARRPACTVP